MPHDVFIPYSSIDKAAAFAACATLEEARIRCWIARRALRRAGAPRYSRRRQGRQLQRELRQSVGR